MKPIELEFLGPAGALVVGQRFPIGAEATTISGRVPRQPGAGPTIIVNDDRVTSGRSGHCRIWIEEEAAWIGDCGSDNGTFLLREDGREPAGSVVSPTALSCGDVVQIVEYRFVVRESGS